MAKTSVKKAVFVYVLEAFDGEQWKRYLPDPGVFLTEAEAIKYCKENTTKTIFFSYKKTIVGSMR